MLTTVISAITMAIDLIPRISAVAHDVAPFIIEAKKAIAMMSEEGSVTDEQLAEVRQKLTDLEASFDAAVAERQRIIDAAEKAGV